MTDDNDVIISEPEDKIEEETQQPGAPPGVAYVGNEGVAHPGDGTAWIGDIVVNPDW